MGGLFSVFHVKQPGPVSRETELILLCGAITPV